MTKINVFINISSLFIAFAILKLASHVPQVHGIDPVGKKPI